MFNGTPSKTALRERLLAARSTRGRAALDAAADGLADHGIALCRDARMVAAYVAITGEPPTHLLLDALRAKGIEVLLPVIAGDGLDWARDVGSRVNGPLGIAEPAGPRLGGDALAAADIVVVPALAVDRRGRRLGRGRGFYDRSLSALDRSGRAIVACVFDEEVLEDIPAEAHDVAVDAALTPSGVVRLG